MKHRCQSSLVRCALRGQHPRTVVYRFGFKNNGVGVWVAVAPLSSKPYLVRRCDEYSLADMHTEVRESLAPARPIPRDVTP